MLQLLVRCLAYTRGKLGYTTTTRVRQHRSQERRRDGKKLEDDKELGNRARPKFQSAAYEN